MKNKVIKTVVFCSIFLSSFSGIAQPSEVADTNGGAPALEDSDAIASSINDYIIPMLLMGVVIGFSLLKKNSTIAS